jgi:hypothetical protein
MMKMKAKKDTKRVGLYLLKNEVLTFKVDITQ